MPDEVNPTPDLTEITPEMIEAGAAVLDGVDCGPPLSPLHWRELAADVYRAMEAARAKR